MTKVASAIEAGDGQAGERPDGRFARARLSRRFAIPLEDQRPQAGDAERGDEEDRGGLREIREDRRRSREQSPHRLALRADVAVPAEDDERGHQRFHDRGAVVHHVDVVGGEPGGGDQAGEASPAPPTHARDAEAEEQHGEHAGHLRHQPRLPGADAEGGEGAVFERREDRRDEHRIPRIQPPLAEQRAIARVVRPGPLVVPDDADGGAPGRIGGRKAESQRGPEQQDGDQSCRERARAEGGRLSSVSKRPTGQPVMLSRSASPHPPTAPSPKEGGLIFLVGPAAPRPVKSASGARLRRVGSVRNESLGDSKKIQTPLCREGTGEGSPVLQAG